MLERFVALGLLGVVLGAFGTLIGAGGGFILVPILLLLYPHEAPEVITSISLAVVCCNALSGSASYARMKRIDYRAGSLFAIATIPGAVFGAMTTGYLPRREFDLLLGVIILAVAVFLLVRPSREPGVAWPTSTGDGPEIDRPHSPPYSRSAGILISAAVGYLSSLLGIGGGIIHVPAMVNLLHFPVHVATATSHFVLVIMAGTGTAVHIVSGAFHHGLRRTIALGIGVMIGAPLGAYLSNRIHGSWIIRALAAALALVALRLLWQGIR